LNDPDQLTVEAQTGARTTALVYRSPRKAGAAIILGHGAGAGQHSSFMIEFARGLSALGFDIVTFNFFYTEQRRRIPDKRPILQLCFRAVIDRVLERVESARRNLFIGGKSMGGRMATHVAADDPAMPIAGLILLGYPLHPPGRPDERRDAHLPAIRYPMLFVQGSRDSFGLPAEFASILPYLRGAAMHVVENGDHSFKVSGRSRDRQAAVHDDIQRVIVDWVRAHSTT
jgi:predicted alpha/beta-hydrolase family hydrolase